MDNNKFAVEATDDVSVDTKKAVVNFVASNLQRFINTEDSDSKSMLMLIAALAMLNTSEENPTAIQTARRLANAALTRVGKKKGK